jgi:hypothetical protein
MISAIRHDASALATDRVITTIKAWQAASADASDERSRAEARRMLEKVGEALKSVLVFEGFDDEGTTAAVPEGADDFTVDAIELPPKAKERRVSRLETPRRIRVSDEEDTEKKKKKRKVVHAETGEVARKARRAEPPSTVFAADDAIVGEIESDSGSYEATPKKPKTGASMPPSTEFVEHEKPTTAIPFPDSSPKTPPSVKAPPPLPPPDAQFDDGDPTRHIDLPKQILERRLDSLAAGLGLPDRTPSGGNGVEFTEMAAAPLRPKEPAGLDLDAVHTLEPTEAPQLIVSDLRLDDPREEPLTPMDPEQRGHSLAPKPGVIRRSTKSRRAQSSPRPRAAMHHVRALYSLLMPFAGELIPLTYERRSRRFWARWREVAGDRGVRREFIEDLLRSASDVRTLVCELIAEVQSVDVRSVYALVEKIDHGADGEERGTPDRQRGPMVGPAIRVEGVSLDDEE